MKLKNSPRFMASLLMLLLVAGCSGSALDPERNKQTVEKKYPKGNIVTLPGSRYKFLVAVDCQVRQVETMGALDEITSDTLLMRVPGCN